VGVAVNQESAESNVKELGSDDCKDFVGSCSFPAELGSGFEKEVGECASVNVFWRLAKSPRPRRGQGSQ